MIAGLHEPKEEKVEFQGRIPKTLHRRFAALFPFNGANVWVINELLERFVTEAENNPSYRDFVEKAIMEAGGRHR